MTGEQYFSYIGMMTPTAAPETITTARLLLRAPRLEDVQGCYDAVMESLDELLPWMPWAHGYTVEGAQESTRQAIASFVTLQDFRYHLFDRENGEFVGSSGLHRVNWQVPRMEIGYWVRSSRAGQGLVTEAVRALSRVAFEELGAARVDIRCDDRNVRSARVAQSCGYELEATLRNWTRATDGSLADERAYVLTSPEDIIEKGPADGNG